MSRAWLGIHIAAPSGPQLPGCSRHWQHLAASGSPPSSPSPPRGSTQLVVIISFWTIKYHQILSITLVSPCKSANWDNYSRNVAPVADHLPFTTSIILRWGKPNSTECCTKVMRPPNFTWCPSPTNQDAGFSVNFRHFLLSTRKNIQIERLGFLPWTAWHTRQAVGLGFELFSRRFCAAFLKNSVRTTRIFWRLSGATFILTAAIAAYQRSLSDSQTVRQTQRLQSLLWLWKA